MVFFYIFDNGRVRKEEIKIREVITFNVEVSDAINATEEIIKLLERTNVNEKIIIVKLYGVLEQGKNSDINFSKIEDRAYKNGAFLFMKTTSRLHIQESEFKVDLIGSENLEQQIINKFQETNPGKFNDKINSLFKSLQVEKIEDEKSTIFEERLISEVRKVLGI